MVWLHQADGDANRLAPDKFSDPLTYDDGGVTGGPTYGGAHLHALKTCKHQYRLREAHSEETHSSLSLMNDGFSSTKSHVRLCSFF